MKMWTGSLFVMMAGAVGVLATASPQLAIVVSGTSGQSLRGGVPVAICAADPANSTDGCPGRETISGKETYRCLGKNLDQYCPASTVDTGKICEKKTDNKCDGKQEKYDAKTMTWVPDGDKCEKVYYTTVKAVKGKCTAATATSD